MEEDKPVEKINWLFLAISSGRGGWGGYFVKQSKKKLLHNELISFTWNCVSCNLTLSMLTLKQYSVLPWYFMYSFLLLLRYTFRVLTHNIHSTTLFTQQIILFIRIIQAIACIFMLFYLQSGHQKVLYSQSVW